MEEISVYGIALVPVLVGLNELLKRTGVPKRFIPFTSMAMGYFFAFYFLDEGDYKKALLYGTVLGLSSIGLFSGAKNTFASPKNKALSK